MPFPENFSTAPRTGRRATTTDSHADCAQQLARNLIAAMGSMTVRQLTESSGVSIGTISNVCRGLSWPNALAVMRLEKALGKALWPAWKAPRRR